MRENAALYTAQEAHIVMIKFRIVYKYTVE